jgi:hypothetical protein
MDARTKRRRSDVEMLEQGTKSETTKNLASLTMVASDETFDLKIQGKQVQSTTHQYDRMASIEITKG